MRIGRNAIVASFALLALAAAPAEPLALKGFRIGMTQQQAQALHPELICEDHSSCRYSGFRNTTDRELDRLADFEANEWKLSFSDGRLEQLTVTLHDRKDLEVVQALTDKYGKPKKTEIVQKNLVGGQWTDSIYEWSRGSDSISLVHLTTVNNPTLLTLTGAAFAKRAAEREREERARRQKGL